MIILLQLLVFIVVFVLRRRRLLGKHLVKHGEGDTNRLMHVSKSKGRVTARTVGLLHKNLLPFMIRKERWYDRWLKSIGLASEVQTKDTRMDEKWFFVTDYPRDLERLVRATAFQEALGKLFDMGIKSLHATSERIWCVLANDLDKEDDTHNAYYEILRELSDKLAASSPYGDPMGKRKSYQACAFIVLGMHLTVLISAAIGFFATFVDSYRIVHLWDWVGLSAAIGVPVLLIWGLGLVSYFQRTSWVGWVMADYVLSGIAGILLLSFVMVRESNITLDVTDPVLHGVPVVSKSCELTCKSSGRRKRSSIYKLEPSQCLSSARQQVMLQYKEKHSRCRSRARFVYEITIEPWIKGKDYFSFNAPERMFDTIAVGETLHVPVHAGYLGLTWVSVGDIKPLPKAY